MKDYHGAFAHGFDESRDIEEPEPVRRVAKKAATASWKSLAAEDLEGTNPSLPIGKCFWPLSRQEKRDIEGLVANKEMHRLATRLRSRDDNEEVKKAAFCASTPRRILTSTASSGGVTVTPVVLALAASAACLARASIPRRAGPPPVRAVALHLDRIGRGGSAT